jgi:predicted acetyltransferase
MDMSDFVIRLVEDGEFRPAYDVFAASLHRKPASDEKWQYSQRIHEPGRVFGAYVDGRPVGVVVTFASSLALPGGRVEPFAAVTSVGVRADHTRRGVLTELMRAQLASAAAAGDVFAGLHASEGVIYGRYGYGAATTSRQLRIQTRRAEVRPEVPRGGEVRLVDADEALSLLPGLYERMLGGRPGMMGRPPGWWSIAYERRLRCEDQMLVAVHTGPDGADGFMLYTPTVDDQSGWDLDATLAVLDLHAANPLARNDLWRFVLGVDLVREVAAFLRPMDEPVEAMLIDQRVLKAEVEDEIWLRLVDVPAALAARSYGDAEPVVLEVRDPLLPANSGRYLISPQGTERTGEPADLAMDVDVLAMAYLGGTRLSALAEVGRVDVTEPAALARADRLFATDVAACCGTMF